uniref:Putative adaptor protein disabled n=1 Tax=Amblyomma aureolatum TaxID=187763 RepID=A0A1E1X8W9_9ACAR
MSNHASTRIDGGRRPNRRSNPKKDKGGSGGGGGSSTGSGSGGKAGDPFRFEGEGLMFRAKLIGSQAVPEARGDRMCQDTMTRLKMAVRASGEHKQRVQLTVSLQGIKIRDDKTGELVFHHPVHRISFISQDASDARAFGYVCMTQDGCHRFIAIKTEKAASQLVVALRDLFQVVLEMKQHELRMAQQEQRQQLQAWTPPNDFSNRGEVQEVICSPQDASSGDPPVPETTPTVDDLLDLQSELDCLQEGIQQMETTIAAAATLASPDPFDTSFVFDPRQQYHPGSRAFMSEPVTPVGPPPPLLPPPPPVARAMSQSAATFGGTAQQQHRAVPPPRTLPFGILPQATASLPPTPLPDLFADLDPLAEIGSSKGSTGFGELRSPPKTLAELLKPTSGWQTFEEEEEEDEGPPPPAFPPPPPPLTALDEGFCSGSNASSVSPSLPPVATATAAAATFSSSSNNSNNIFSRCGGQDPFADEFFAAPSTPGSKDFTVNASPARPALLPGLSTNSSPWPMSPQTTAPLRR